MMKLTIVLVFAAVIYSTNGLRQRRDLEDKVPDVPEISMGFGSDFPKLPPLPDLPKPLTEDDIKNLKPADKNTVVSGASVSSSSSVDTVNGVPVKKESSGRIVTNNNGKVKETSFGN